MNMYRRTYFTRSFVKEVMLEVRQMPSATHGLSVAHLTGHGGVLPFIALRGWNFPHLMYTVFYQNGGNQGGVCVITWHRCQPGLRHKPQMSRWVVQRTLLRFHTSVCTWVSAVETEKSTPATHTQLVHTLGGYWVLINPSTFQYVCRETHPSSAQLGWLNIPSSWFHPAGVGRETKSK